MVNGDKLKLNYNEALDTNSTPATTDFTVSVAGTNKTPSEVSVSGSAVTLTLGTPVFGETVTVTYTKGTNPIRDLEENDAAALSSQAVTNNNASSATIDLVRIVSAPTYDADSDGTRDTFVQGDKILVDVEYNVPVTVDGTPRLRLQLGDSATLADNRKLMNMESELHGGRTLRFAYTVAASDTDTTGVWVETSGSNKTVVFLPTNVTIVGADSGVAAGLTRTGLPTTGDANAKVDGAKTATDTGPRPTGATVNGATLEVTFDKALDASVDTSEMPLYFSVYGTQLSGGNRNAYQHPSTVAFAAGDSMKLVLTLGDPARAGDTVKLNYTLIDHTGLVKDTDDKQAPAFFDLAVTNNTAGTVGPAPSRASMRLRTLQMVFDGDLDEASTPAGSAFLVETSDFDGDRRSIAGTGTATVSGATVTVELDLDANEDPVGPDDYVLVSYTVPTSNPLRNAEGDDVLAFERFRVETVLDAIPPEFVGGEAMQTSASPATSKVVIYFDEPLDTTSVPVAANFFVLLPSSTIGTISSIAVEGDAVTLTLSNLLAGGAGLSVRYFSGSDTIRDLVGNAAAAFAHGMTAATAATPALETSGTDAPAVNGATLTLTYDLPLDPAKVPGTDRYTFHYQLASGETERDDYPRKTAAVAVRNKKIVLRLDAPVYPCDPEPTVSYAQETGGPNVQGLDGQAVAAISHQVVDNKRESACTTSEGVSGNSGGQGKSFTLKFGRTLDTGRALQASAFRLAGASAPSVADAAYTADAAGVVLTLDRALAPGETVEARYERPMGEPGLWDTEGKQIADFSGVTVPVRTSGPPPLTAAFVGMPALLSVADARATEGVDSAVEFAVTLSRAASGTVTVDYATADGTATAGEDYTATSGTLTFAAGETAKTVAVPVLDDAHDEGEETFRFRLSNAQGAVIADRVAVGTIVNEDRMLRAWLARFGRTAWEHTLDAVQHRLDGAGNAATRAAVAGREMRAASADPGADDAQQLAELAAWIDGSEKPQRTVSVPELLAGSAFQVAASADEAGGGLTVWGQGAYGRFEGRDGDLSVDGEVAGATLGVDYATGPWLAGLALSHSSGWGSYAQPAARGEVTGALTGAFPYVGVEVVPERLALWVAGGYGIGSQRLTPAGAPALESPIDLLAGAAGVRGTVVAAPAAGGFSLGLNADGSLLRATSEATTGLAAATADVDRVRLGLEGSYEVALGGGARLTPSVEVGVRRDGGAAETGFGMDMGGGLRFAHPGLGLSLGLSGRALVVHETADLVEWGAGGSLSWDPNPVSDLGPALTVAPSIGASAHGGAATLWSRQTLAGLDGAAGATAAGRVDARFAYGVPLAGGVAAPWAGIRVSEGAREYRLGHVFHLSQPSASDLRIELTATRREPTGAEPEHAISVQSTVRW